MFKPAPRLETSRVIRRPPGFISRASAAGRIFPNRESPFGA